MVMQPSFGDVVRGIAAAVCLVIALVLFPWDRVQSRDSETALNGFPPNHAGERFESDHAAGAMANAAELIHEDMRQIKCIGMFGLAVLMAGPIGRKAAPRNAPPI